MYSRAALTLYAAKKEGIIKSDAAFYRDFGDIGKTDKLNLNADRYAEYLKTNGISITCVFDDDFPAVSANVKPGEKPYFFAYKGDISLLFDRTKNVAIAGTLTPDYDIITREKQIVKRVVNYGYNIVSGLALGCVRRHTTNAC